MTITQFQHLSGARLVEQRAPALLKRWILDNVITLTSDDSRNIGDDSRNSMDVSRTCVNRTLRESSVNHLFYIRLETENPINLRVDLKVIYCNIYCNIQENT